jgi:hypothetical protein
MFLRFDEPQIELPPPGRQDPNAAAARLCQKLP